MIPYFEFTHFSLGPITIQVWGLLVALGIITGTITSAWFTKKNGEDKQVIYDGAVWIVLSAFLFARLVHVFLYDYTYYLQNVSDIFKVWHGGFSVMGGFVGAIIGYALFSYKNKLDWKKFVDLFMFGLPLGLACGRVGCFLIHDHPGTLTNSLLGVKQSDGMIRHDHGLYLMMANLILAIIFLRFSNKKHHQGFYAQVFLVYYGIVRFILDFWRIIDIRYGLFTPAQYVCVLMVLGGIIWYVYSKKKLNT